jgi:Uma2 family endonuclease
MALATDSAIVYPDSDGQPMADNTLQFRWIVLIKENLECLFADDPQVFVGGDLLWYPVEGRPEIRVAPDVMVAVGRPKGERGAYRQWQEEQIPPQVVFEVLSPGNTFKEMAKKLKFYDRYGVEEYYVYDPAGPELTGFQRLDGELAVIEEMVDWVSPRLGIRFGWVEQQLQLCYPDGRSFLTMVELAQQRDQAQQRAERLAAKLRELGIDPEEI